MKGGFKIPLVAANPMWERLGRQPPTKAITKPRAQKNKKKWEGKLPKAGRSAKKNQGFGFKMGKNGFNGANRRPPGTNRMPCQPQQGKQTRRRTRRW